jgi:hypothetical protein
MTQSEKSSIDVTSELASEELAKRAQRLLELSEEFPGVTPVEDTSGTTERWLFNTGIRDIRNLTSQVIRVRNPETQTTFTLNPPPGGKATVDWFAPWVDNPTEFSNKSITVRVRPPGADPSNPGTLVFRFFLDFDNEIVSWVPAGGAHTDRNPIELTPGGGVFLTPVSRIDVTVNAVTLASGATVIVPGASVVTF